MVLDPFDGLQAQVLDWGAAHLRDLPWRRTRDPWGILVSEVMLQQTQDERVLTHWPEFLSVFPDPATCAGAPLAHVLRLWQGLGYPRRARNLHQSAAAVVESGGFPTTLEGLLALPGVGPYTARAVLTFAFEADVAVVDTNVARVLQRVMGQRLTARLLQEAADAALVRGRSWLWNQALMDLGATVCVRRSPACHVCPAQRACRWQGRSTDPDPAARRAPQAPFQGSGRQARGRLLRALAEGPVSPEQVPGLVDRTPDVAEQLVRALIDDGLISSDGTRLHLGDDARESR